MPPIRKTNWKKQIHRGNQTKLNWTDVEAHLTQQIQHISQAIDFDFDEDPLGDHCAWVSLNDFTDRGGFLWIVEGQTKRELTGLWARLKSKLNKSKNYNS